jgi:hypothetical protein
MKQFFFSLIALLLLATWAFSQKDISVYPQPDSPLQISNETASWSVSKDDKDKIWNTLKGGYVIKNVSDKPIRAYTIRKFTGDFMTDTSVTEFVISSSEKGFLQPGKSTPADLGNSSYSPDRLAEIKLAVDYVEFSDGTIWGMDLSHSAEQSEGIKAGRKAGKEYLLKTKEQNGISEVVKSLDNQPVISPPQNQTQKWQRGFTNGLKYFIYDLKRTYKEKGVEGLEAELQKTDIVTK